MTVTKKSSDTLSLLTNYILKCPSFIVVFPSSGNTSYLDQLA